MSMLLLGWSGEVVWDAPLDTVGIEGTLVFGKFPHLNFYASKKPLKAIPLLNIDFKAYNVCL